MNCIYCHKESERFCCSEECYNLYELRNEYKNCNHYHLWKYRTPLAIARAQNNAAWAWADAWTGDQSAFIHGPEGVGKSALCKYLLCRRFEAYHAVENINAADIELKMKFDFQGERRWRLENIETLLIDDIHNVEWSTRGLDLLHVIIDARHEAGFITLVTSNVGVKDFQGVIDSVSGTGRGVLTLRRLHGRRRCQVIKMTGESLRVKIAEGVKCER